MKLIFFGSPDFAVPSLRSLHAAGHEIALVVTRPDRPRGRSRKPQPTAVKETALELGLAVYQPESANAAESVDVFARAGADLGVVVAYGEILNADALGTTAQGCLNVHASLLPDYRGAAPINWAVVRGETRTGVSIIRMVPRLDAGPVLARRELAIGQDETAGELSVRLAELGASAATDVVARLSRGEEIEGEEQPPRSGFFARKLTKADGRVDWSLPAGDVRNLVRGLSPWPGAYADLLSGGEERRVVLLRADVVDGSDSSPGTVLSAGSDGLVVQCGGQALCLRELKPAGARLMDAAAFVRGHRVEPGDRFI